MTRPDTWPTVSVVVPCKNMGAYVGDAIRSALSQTRPPTEIIVVDDGSTDDTREVASSFGSVVKLLHGPGRGSAISRNIAIMAATSDYIAFLDADDLWYPQHLELQIGRMLAEGRGFSFSDFHRAADPANPGPPKHLEYSTTAEGDVFSNLLRENFVPTSSAIVRRDVLAETGLFKPQLRGGQDYDLWLRIARVTQFTWLRPCLVFLRHHDGNITGSPSYPYFHVRVWEEIRNEHRNSTPADVQYVRGRLAMAEYNAGRHAVREQKFGLARGYFARSIGHGHSFFLVLPWLALTCAPGALVALLLRVKRNLSHAASPSRMAASGGKSEA